MRPYLAIIIDSFREAMSSWVLWILLGTITIFLLVIAPLGIRQKLATHYLGGIEFRDALAFTQLLKAAADKPEPSVAKHVWSSLEKKDQEALENVLEAIKKDDSGNAHVNLPRILATGLNNLLPKEDFYAKEVWKEVRLNEEAQGYVDKGREALDNEERLRMNRVLLEAAFPDQFLPQPPKSLAGTYLFWETPGALPVPQTTARSVIEEVFLAYFLSWIVGSVGVLVAIVVTASIIPQMFDPGALHLLLSKPVNRSILFLSKFIGGCAFTLLNVGYLLVGLWLILGLRFGIWNVGLLYCIPIFVFMFAVYYAVSALASVMWRNAIVSVIITVMFWGLCFSVGFMKVNIFDPVWIRPKRLVQLIPARDALLSMNEDGVVQVWNEAGRDWQPIFRGQGNRGMAHATYVEPLYDAEHEQLVGANAFQMLNVQIPVQVALGKQSEGWVRKTGLDLPGGAVDMFVEPKQNRQKPQAEQPNLLVLSTNGLFRLVDVPPRRVLGVEITLGSGPQFVRAQADDSLLFNEPLAGALSEESGQLAIFSRGIVYVFAIDAEGKYAVKKKTKLEVDEDNGAILAFEGESLVVAREDGKVQLLDSSTLAVEAEFRPESRSQPRFVSAAPDGKKFAVVFQNGKLYVLDVESKKMRRAPVWGQGTIFAAAFKSANRLLVSDRTARVSEYAADTFKLQSRLSPDMLLDEQIYRYGVLPLYTVCPRPSEFGYTMKYALTGTESSSKLSTHMHARRDSLNPWTPVWSGLIFMIVVLGLACVYIERSEF